MSLFSHFRTMIFSAILSLASGVAFAAPHTSLASQSETPSLRDFLDLRTAALIREIDLRPARHLETANTSSAGGAPVHLTTGANKKEWLRLVYTKNLVEASRLTEMLSDKLIQSKIFGHYLGDKGNRYLLHSVGLKEFLRRYKLVDAQGVLVQDAEAFENALAEEFPTGFIVRPSLGVAPHETHAGMFATSDDFIKELFKTNSILYTPESLFLPIKSHILGATASGESVILQEDFVRTSALVKKIRIKSFEKVRIHTFEDRIVRDSIPELWVVKRNFKIDDSLQDAAEKYVQEFLHDLPATLTAHQAWGVDVGVADNGQMRIIDVLTNRGLKQAWSSYLEEPKVLGAYVRHFESCCGFEFQGFSGFLLRHDLANIPAYWQKRREKSAAL